MLLWCHPCTPATSTLSHQPFTALPTGNSEEPSGLSGLMEPGNTHKKQTHDTSKASWVLLAAFANLEHSPRIAQGIVIS
jgi:hypothetical protein